MFFLHPFGRNEHFLIVGDTAFLERSLAMCIHILNVLKFYFACFLFCFLSKRYASVGLELMTRSREQESMLCGLSQPGASKRTLVLT